MLSEHTPYTRGMGTLYGNINTYYSQVWSGSIFNAFMWHANDINTFSARYSIEVPPSATSHYFFETFTQFMSGI